MACFPPEDYICKHQIPGHTVCQGGTAPGIRVLCDQGHWGALPSEPQSLSWGGVALGQADRALLQMEQGGC